VKSFEVFFRKTFEQAGPPGAAVVLVVDDQILLLKGYGVSSTQSCQPVGVHTVFRIGSLSKGFAGVLTAILAGQGLVGWDDPVRCHYPDFMLVDQSQAERIRIRHLLSHSIGLPYHAFDLLVESGLGIEDIVCDHLPNTPLYSREGEQHRYQNAAFSIIEPVLEHAAGQSYPDLLRRWILEPAQLLDASHTKEGLLSSSDHALPHLLVRDGYVPLTVSDKYYTLASAGGMNLSISDLGAWLMLLLGNRRDVIPDTCLQHVFTPVVGTASERNVLPGWIERGQAFYGYGWRILAQGSDTIAYHSGFVNNYQAEIALDRHRKIGIGVLYNGKSPLKGKVIQQFFELADLASIGR
jgi:beta-lactamase class C